MTAFVPPADLLEWMQHDTLDACHDHFRYDGWANDPKVVGVLAQRGTPVALGYFSSRCIEQFQLNRFPACYLIESIDQGLVVGLDELQALVYLTIRIPFEERRDVLSTEDQEDEWRLNDLLYEEEEYLIDEYHAEPDEDEVSYISNEEAAKVLLPMARVIPPTTCPNALLRFVQRLEPIFCRPTPRATRYRPVFLDLLDILITRGLPFEVPDRRGRTLRQYLAQWGQADLDALFEPPCDLK